MITDTLNDIINSGKTNTAAYSISLFVRDHILEISEMSIRDLASQCYVSKGQISKYVNQLGYESYADFRDACRAYAESLPRKVSSFLPSLSLHENISAATRRKCMALQEAADHLDEKALSDLMQNMKNAETIYVFAQGNSRYLAHYLQGEGKMAGLNIQITDEHMRQNILYDKNDLLLVISVSGKTFVFDPRIRSIVNKAPVRKWLITCRKDLSIDGRKLLIYCPDESICESAVEHVLSLIAADFLKAEKS